MLVRTKLLAAALLAALAFSPVAASAQAAKPTPAATPTPPAKADELIDINSATKAQLMTLEGIGEARSDAIIKGRPYRGKNELADKSIIPQAVYDKIKDKIIAKQTTAAAPAAAPATPAKKP